MSEWPKILLIENRQDPGDIEIYLVENQEEVNKVLRNFVEYMLTSAEGANAIRNHSLEKGLAVSGLVEDRLIEEFFKDYVYRFSLKEVEEIKEPNTAVCDEEGVFFVGRDESGEYLYFGKPVKTVIGGLFRVVGEKNWAAPLSRFEGGYLLEEYGLVELNDQLYSKVFMMFCDDVKNAAEQIKIFEERGKDVTLKNMRLITRELDVLMALLKHYKGRKSEEK